MSPIRSVGIVGGGQLAVMMTEAAQRLGLEVEALVRCPDDPILRVLPNARVGDACSAQDLRWLADRSDVVTFDHELVDYRLVAKLEAEGHVFRPGSTALAIAIDKEQQWGLFSALELRQPEMIVVHNVETAFHAIEQFDGAAVLKTSTGGYDGRGVLLDVAESVVRGWYPERSAAVLVQKRVDVAHEVAVQVARADDGSVVTYAPVRTVQSDGMCSYVCVPSGLDTALDREAIITARRIADAIDAVGILTVEFFVVDGELVVNELAARPHNSGHLTIEATRTSQFENHMRAVAGLPLASTEQVACAAAMANIVGDLVLPSSTVTNLAKVAVYRYGKTPRPGRKLGHVTAVADSTQVAIERAVGAANELQTTAKQPFESE